MTLSGNCVRALDSSGDWSMGNGSAGYLQQDSAIGQQVPCNCKVILGEVFWALNIGINWYAFLSSDQPQALSLALKSTILNSVNVTGINNPAPYLLDPITRAFSTPTPWSLTTVFTKNLPVTVTSPIEVF